MKVLLIDVNCKYSSTGKIVYDLYRKLLEEGHDAAICYGRGKLIQEHNIYKFGVDWETFLHAGLSRITGLNGCYSSISTRRLIKYIEKFNPDVVHIHELHAYFVNIKPLINYLKKKKKKIVWTFHCEYMYTGKCGHAYDCMNFTKECGNCPAVKEYPKSLFLDRTRKMFREKKKMLEDLDFTIVTPSKWLADRVKMSFLKNKHIEVIHNGVDTTIFFPRSGGELKKKFKISNNKHIILFVAPDVMSKRKGGDWALKLAEEMINDNVVFVFVGGGKRPDQIPENIVFAGEIYDQQILAQFYSMADVYLLCSEKETYSMTCAEAISCGTPVAGFRCGAPETVFKGVYAKFVEYGDLIGLKSAVIESFDVKKTMKVDADYSTEYMVKQYMFQYKND